MSRPRLATSDGCSGSEHLVEHWFGEPARERVLLARVVAAEYDDLPAPIRTRTPGRIQRHIDRDSHAVAEPGTRPRYLEAQPTERSPQRVPAERARGTRLTRTVGSTNSSSASSHGEQVSRSPGVGALAGGAQRTAATIRVPTSRWPSPACSLVARSASPTRCREANSQSPDRSPVNTRPVRLPPLAAGARPTTRTRGCPGSPPGDRPSPVRLLSERRALLDRHLLAPGDQPRAGAADRDPSRQLGERPRAPGQRRPRRRHPPPPRLPASPGRRANQLPGGTGLVKQVPVNGCGSGRQRHAIDQAIPSRMSRAETTSSGRPTRSMTRQG